MKRFIILFLTIMALTTTQAADKVLVAYFSATGTTKAVAEQIALAAGADLMAIEPVEPYTAADLNWRNKQSRCTKEMNDEQSRPAIRKTKENLNDYAVVYVGFPVWWYVAPRIVNTFLEAYSFEGKTIIPFATSGGSGIEGCTQALRRTYPALYIEDGKLLNHTSYDEIQAWVVR